MQDSNATGLFEKAPVSQAVLKSALPAMAAMLMVLIYNLADTFFVGQTHDAYQVAAVSLAMPVFLMFMAVGTVFGMFLSIRCRQWERQPLRSSSI